MNELSMINTEYIKLICGEYRNPWHLISIVYEDSYLSREDILDIVEIFNKNTKYKD